MPSAKLPNLPSLCIASCLLILGSLFSLTFSPQQINAQFGQCDDLDTSGRCTIHGVGSPPGEVDLEVTVSGLVKETAIQLQGYSAPGAFILVSEDTDVVGAGTADSVTGEFNFFLTALQAGVPHSIVLVAANQDQVTPGMGFVVQPVAHSVVSVSNIVLPPFIDVTPSAADSGVPITVSGQSTPGGDITLFVEPGSLNTTTVVDANGDWSVELIGEFGTLAQGTYTASATVTVSSHLSDPSREVDFEVRPVQSSTFLQLNGYGPPGGFLAFKADNMVVASDVVPANGIWSTTIQFPDVDDTLDISITADDGGGGQFTPPTNFTQAITSQETTVVNDILLPTFIDVSPLIAQAGDPITASGVAMPNATLELQIESPTATEDITIDAAGDWSQELLAAFGQLAEGVYTVSAVVRMDGLSLISERSREITITINEVTTATDLVVEGYGPPGAFLTFSENNLVIGSDTIPASGQFTHTLKFTDQTQPHTISIVASNSNQQTPPTTFTITVTAFSVTTVSNIVLPTFIEVIPTQVPHGNTVIAKGVSAPNSLVQVFVRTPLMDKMVTSSSDGTWQLDLNTINGVLNKGRYTAYARTTVLPQSYQSGLSREVEFEVVEANDCANRRSDMNCDGRVDITDLGILIFYWGGAGAGQKADINKDGKVDISDVGIMVYDWTY